MNWGRFEVRLSQSGASGRGERERRRGEGGEREIERAREAERRGAPRKRPAAESSQN